MPLVMMCGPPCSGKSTRADQLKVYMSKEHPETPVIVIDDIALSTMNRNALYGADKSSFEKESRGRLRSEVQKTLSKDTIVILDAPNYIKGFRYELYCLCKGCKTTQCVVHCDVGVDVAWMWNCERMPQEDRYERPVFDALFARFEAPESRNRWDSPLFVVTPDDEATSFAVSVHASLVGRKPPPPNQSTQCQPLSATTFLYDIDRTTREVVAGILEAQKLNSGESEVFIPTSDTKLRLAGQTYTPMHLARLRRQFIVYIKMRPVEDQRKLASMFVHYVNGGLLTDR